MPFTPTHALAAIPLNRLWPRNATFSALVIGSMVPDWPLYVPLSPTYDVTHSLAGLFTSCLPIGFALALVFHIALKRSLFELLPDGLKARVMHYVDAPSILQPATLLTIAVAVLIGAASHVAWDAFTHRGAWGVALIPQLNDTLLSPGGVNLPGYVVLQHGFTLLGAPVFVLVYCAWYRKAEALAIPAPQLSPAAQRGWQVILLGIPAGLMIETTVKTLSAASLRGGIYELVQGVTRTGLVLLVLLALFAVFFALSGRRREALEAGS